MNVPGLFEPTPAEQRLLALIRQHESAGTYNILCGGSRFSDYSKFPTWPGYKGSHAAGAYQFEPATWAEWAAAVRVPDFSPLAQDIAALYALRKWGPNSTETWQASGPYPEHD